MSTLEKEVIRRYRQAFPQETLKVISQKTGIQITRVFRIMNGKPMKVKELEIFQKILESQTAQGKSFTEIERLTKMAVSTLSIKDLEQIITLIERKLKNFELKHCPAFSFETEDLIA